MTEQAIKAYFDKAYLILDAMEVAPERLKPLRTLTEGLQDRRK